MRSTSLRQAAWQCAVLLLALAVSLLSWRPAWLAEPSTPQAVAFLAAALLAGSLLPARAMRVVTGLAHETGHALIAAACGGVPMRILLSRQGDGACESLLPPGRGRAVLVAAAGQQGPGILAMTGALAIGAGRTDLLYAGCGLLALLLLAAAARTRAAVGTAAGVATAAATASVTLALLPNPPATALACLAGTACGLLAGAGLRASMLDARDSRHAPRSSDEARIAELVKLPVPVVAWTQAATSALLAVACLKAAW